MWTEFVPVILRKVTGLYDSIPLCKDQRHFYSTKLAIDNFRFMDQFRELINHVINLAKVKHYVIMSICRHGNLVSCQAANLKTNKWGGGGA